MSYTQPSRDPDGIIRDHDGTIPQNPSVGFKDVRSTWPQYDDDEISAVSEILKSGRVNALQHGDNCSAFESEFAQLCQMPHAIAVANGTLGLELALRGLQVGPGDEVIVTARSFIASASCIVNCGASAVFADIDLTSQNISAETVKSVMTERTRAIIAVHLAGHPCDMDPLCALAQEHGIAIIEDCAQAHGATYKGRPIGSFGSASVFSFCTDKIMSTGGEGGMLLLRDMDAYRRAWSYKDHGKDYDLVKQKSSGNAFRWIHTSIGSNFRMTEMQAAIGLRQLKKLEIWIEQRRQRAAVLFDALEDLAAIRVHRPSNQVGHSFYKFYAFIDPAKLKPDWSRDRILLEAKRLGVPCQSGSCPEIYLEQAFNNDNDKSVSLPNAKSLGVTSILLPVDPTLSIEDVEYMGQTLRLVVETATA